MRSMAIATLAAIDDDCMSGLGSSTIINVFTVGI
jgi:hypothetical protein